MRSKIFVFYVVGSLLTAIVFYGVIELTTRTVSWVQGSGFRLALHELEPYDQAIESIYQWHPFTGFTFKPHSSVVGGHPNQRGNAYHVVDRYGFLAPPHNVNYQPDDTAIRIATIGASTTASVNLSYEDNWPGHLGRLLQQALPDRKIQMINAGVPGFDTAQSIVNLALRVMPLKPDLVIIYHAYNDLKAIRPDRIFKPDYSHIHTKPYGFHTKPSLPIRLLNKSMFYVRLRNQYREYNKTINKVNRLAPTSSQQQAMNKATKEGLQAFTQHIRILISIARAEGAHVILSSFATLHDPALNYLDAHVLQNLSEMQQRELAGITHFIPGLSIPAFFNALRQYNEALESIALSEKTGWIDSAAAVPHHDDYFVDRVHFSRQGGRRMAENMLPVVLDALKPSQSHPSPNTPQAVWSPRADDY